jgi:hypothetical protein
LFLLNYGSGCGILSFLAAEMGIGTVIYNDIYDISCTDVKILSNALRLKLSHIVCGDVDELISYLQKNSISINAITSYDVIEHIYNVEYHFRKLGCLKNSKFRIVYASGANIKNPRYVHSIKKKQIQAEYNGKHKEWGDKERDTLQPYLDVRRQIISAYAPDLSAEVIEHLARSSRGLIRQDIEKCIDEYRLLGRINYHIEHPTNTCDPYTGNWCEHLMNLEWLKRIIKNAGFSVEITPGFYEIHGSLPQKIVKILINATIKLLDHRGMFLAPYYVVLANFNPNIKET